MSVVALVLFVLFNTLVPGALFPFRPLDSAWQLRLAGALISAAPSPLAGLALLQLASELNPDDQILQRRWRRCSRLAVAAALVFLLLLPLQGVAGLRGSRAVNSAQRSRILGAERTLAALRQAVASAGSNNELNLQLQRLQGPVLGPADIVQPLRLLKAQVSAVLDQAQLQINKERQSVPPLNPWNLLQELLLNSVAALALAIGFASLAVRPGREISMLEACRLSWNRLRLRRNHDRLKSRRQEDLDFLRQINGDTAD